MNEPPDPPLTFSAMNLPPGPRVATALAKISLVMRHRAWRDGMGQDLTPTQAQALTFLDRQPGATLGQVADALGIKAPTASEAVGTLEHRGLLTKSRHPDDARRLALFLTAAGRRQAEEVALWPDFLARVVHQLSDQEQAVLLRTLQLMIRELQVRGEVPIAQMCSTCRFFRPFVHADEAAPHHCAFVDLPFGDRDLRFDCREQEAATGAEAESAWRRFAERRLAQG